MRTDKPAPYVQVVENDKVAHKPVEPGARGDAEQRNDGGGQRPGARGAGARGNVGPLREGTAVRFTQTTAAGASSAPAAAKTGALGAKAAQHHVVHPRQPEESGLRHHGHARLVVLGLFSYQRLKVDQFPNVDFPVVVVTAEYPGASPEIVESEVTKKIEEGVNSIAGINTLTSRSYEGQSVVIIEFQLHIDGRKAAEDVREKVAAIRPSFRTEVKEPRVLRFDPASRADLVGGGAAGRRARARR